MHFEYKHQINAPCNTFCNTFWTLEHIKHIFYIRCSAMCVHMWCSAYTMFCYTLEKCLVSTIYTPRPTKLEGGGGGGGGGGGVYWIHLVRPSVRPSVCRRHGFGSISQVCFRISISNSIGMLMVAIGRSLLIFSDITFKMAAWWPYWIFRFLDSVGGMVSGA